ncbi:MAG: hypothetical protein K0B02_02140 [DPANN group archaeon]|nr:hypothetical protein [DPANN group archaeon]
MADYDKDVSVEENKAVEVQGNNNVVSENRIENTPLTNNDFRAVPPMPPKHNLGKDTLSSASNYTKGPMFISIDRFNALKNDIDVLRNTLDALSRTMEKYKQSKSVSSALLQETTDEIELIEVKVANINSVVRS